MRVVVTGGTGHLGGTLVRALLERGRSVRVLVRRRGRALEGLDVETVEGDLRDRRSLRAAFRGAEVVYNMAGVVSIDGDRSGLLHDVNVVGTGNVARVALECGVGRLVHCSSIHALDPHPLDEPADERRPAADNDPACTAYDRSKADGDREVLRCVDRGLDAVIVQPTAVIGPFDFGPSRTGIFFRDLYRRRIPALVPGGFDWVDVRDVAAATISAAERGRRGENYIVAGHWCSVRELASIAAAVTGIRPPALTVPLWLARVGAPVATWMDRRRGREPLYTVESLRAMRTFRHLVRDRSLRELRHRPRPLVETVRDVYRWFGEQGVVPQGVADDPARVRTGTASI